MIGQWTDQGDRTYQEDQVFVGGDKDFNIIAVADGMGGHVNGAEAATTAVTYMAALVPDLKNLFSKTMPADILSNAIIALVTEAYTLAHVDISLAGTPRDNRGTTLTVCIQHQDRAWFFNEGDSYGFVIKNNNQLQNITVPHGSGHIVHRMLGGYPTCQFGHMWGAARDCKPDFYVQDIASEDLLVVATDGIHAPDAILVDPDTDGFENMSATQVAECIGLRGLSEYRRLYPGQGDNCSVAVIKVE